MADNGKNLNFVLCTIANIYVRSSKTVFLKQGENSNEGVKIRTIWYILENENSNNRALYNIVFKYYKRVAKRTRNSSRYSNLNIVFDLKHLLYSKKVMN